MQQTPLQPTLPNQDQVRASAFEGSGKDVGVGGSGEVAGSNDENVNAPTVAAEPAKGKVAMKDGSQSTAVSLGQGMGTLKKNKFSGLRRKYELVALPPRELRKQCLQAGIPTEGKPLNELVDVLLKAEAMAAEEQVASEIEAALKG